MSATQAQATANMSVQEANKIVLQRYLDEIFNQRNYAAIDELIHPDFHCEPPSFHVPWGFKDFKEGVPKFLAMFSNAQWRTLEMLAERDLVAGIFEFRGMHTGESLGIAPTGKEIRFTVNFIYQIKDGKVIGTRKLNVNHNMDFFTAMGLPKAPGFVHPSPPGYGA
jgi:predicted ester cyclase